MHKDTIIYSRHIYRPDFSKHS